MHNSKISSNCSRVEKVLLLAYFEHQSVPSIKEGIDFVKAHSQFHITVLNLAEHRVDDGYLKMPSTLDLEQFYAIIIHNTVSYSVDNLKALDQVTNIKLKEFNGVKIIMRQDEHYRFREFISFVSEINADYIFSVMPEEEIENTYGLYSLSAQIIPMLTGYVMPSMRAQEPHLVDRPIDIGYRGSIMPLSFGKLCYQKRKIGDEVLRRLSGNDISLDISSRWEDRIGGMAWFEFLSSCKAVLGVESGTGLFDLDGSLEYKCAEIEKNLGLDDGSDCYAEKYLSALKDIDGAIKYYTISPRHFEAIACGAVQILMPGKYSGRMIAGRHYIELSEDFSNLKEVIDFVLDEAERKSMAKIAYSEVINNRINWIESLVESLDNAISKGLIAKGLCIKPLISSFTEAKNILIIQAHNHGSDPRRDSWYSSATPKGLNFTHLGIMDGIENEQLLLIKKGELVITTPRLTWDSFNMASFVHLCAEDIAASGVLRELFFIANALKLSDQELYQIYGIPTNDSHLSRFRWYLNYILNTSYTLIMNASRMRGVHTILAINFPSLPAAIVIKFLFGIQIVYEALEYWPEADPHQTEAEQLFWTQIEKRIVGFADFRGTVSPGLANLMRERYGVDFYYVPNCVPLCTPLTSKSSLSDNQGYIRNKNKTYFLYQGSYAKGRNIETLINAWKNADERAILLLRGPENSYKREMMELVKRLDVNKNFARVIFLDAIAPDKLVECASEVADVGIIPYGPLGANYRDCSPNKLGQYMAAGLPILANHTNFVVEIVNKSKCGRTVNFSNEKKLLDTIKDFCDDDLKKLYSKNSIEFFKSDFNWDRVSSPFYKALLACVAGREKEEIKLFPFMTYRAISHQVEDFIPRAALITNTESANTNSQLLLSRRLWGVLPNTVKNILRPILRKII